MELHQNGWYRRSATAFVPVEGAEAVFFMRTPMQRNYATEVAHRRRGEQ